MDKFDCERTIRMIPAKLFIFNLDVFSNENIKICLFQINLKSLQLNYFDKICLTEHVNFLMFYILYAFFLIKKINVQFKPININDISYEIKISYEGHFVKVEIKFKKFLTILSPNMDDQR